MMTKLVTLKGECDIPLATIEPQEYYDEQMVSGQLCSHLVEHADLSVPLHELFDRTPKQAMDDLNRLRCQPGL